ncbi:MAG: chemotaxis protein CheX [Armatimonadota bacterium]
MTRPTEQLERTLLEITEATCETLAFMFPTPPIEDESNARGDYQGELTHVRVYFAGPFAGSLALSMPRSMLPALAANMLGLDEQSTTSEQRIDAARELCNVVCGNLLPAVAGREPVFSVSPPELCDDPGAPDSAACVRSRAWLDEGWVEARFTVDGGLDRLPHRRRDEPGADGLRSIA